MTPASPPVDLIGALGRLFAQGGPVTGGNPATDPVDNVPARLTSGEFVVNREAATHFRDVLRLMNQTVRPGAAPTPAQAQRLATALFRVGRRMHAHGQGR